MATCLLCGKTPGIVNNIPHSVHKTKRLVRPNLQKINGLLVCTRCARTIKKYQQA